MTYTEQPQTARFSCTGCVFNKEQTKIKASRTSKGMTQVTSIGIFGCYAPNDEPFRSCMRRGVIFK